MREQLDYLILVGPPVVRASHVARQVRFLRSIVVYNIYMCGVGLCARSTEVAHPPL